MSDWEHKVEVAHGRWLRGPVNADDIQRVLRTSERDGWELCSAVPLTQLGFTAAVWLLFKRPAGGRPG
ncbi:MAG: hypothetical protein ACREN7_09145 [Candidatus Dormibacteria bacterium]